jgi:glucose-1-phosphate thymidylyltransferase
MNIVILAGGFATRLYPITESYPKALLTVREKPILTHLTQELSRLEGIDQAVLVSNSRYLPHFEAWKQTANLPFELALIDNGVAVPEERKGAVGDLLVGLAAMNARDTLVLASDTLIPTPLPSFIDFAVTKQAPATMLIDLKDPQAIANRLGCAVLAEDGRLHTFVEKPKNPPSTLAAVPYYYYPLATLPLIKQYFDRHKEIDAPGSLLSWLITQTTMYGYLIEDGYYFDIGTEDNWKQAEAHFAKFS